MSSSNRWAIIRDALLRRPRKEREDYKLEQLMAVLKQRSKTGIAERIGPSETLMRRCELLYRLEPLIFSGVNKLTRRITGSKIYFTGEIPEENTKAMQFMEESGLLSLLPHLVKDALIYGFGVAEIRQRGNTFAFHQIYPLEFDYQREGTEIAVDSKGNIKGYVWRRGGEEVELTPSEVLLIRFFTLGQYCLGISPIEAAFKSAWIKLNLEEALGEAIYRHGFPLVKFKIGTPEQGPWHEITPEKIKAAKKIITDLQSASELILPWWMDAEILAKRSDLGNINLFIDLLGMEILAAFEMPKSFGTAQGVGSRAVEELDFEKSVLAFQEELKRQLEEQVLNRYFELNNFKSRPKLTFAEYAPELQNIRLRRLSAYAKHGLITRTDDLENTLRELEGFPPKVKKKEPTDQCIFGLGTCPVRAEESLPLDRLAAFCNICVQRLAHVQTLKTQELDEQK